MDNLIENVEVFPFQKGMSPVTCKLIEALKNGKVGDVIFDEKLKEICGRDTRPNHNGYGCLMTAIKHIRNEFNVVWERQRGANSIKCLDAGESLNLANGHMRHMNKTANTTGSVLNTININELDEAKKKECLTLKAVCGTQILLSQRNTIKKLMAREAKETMPLDRLLAGFNSIK